jgi:hypothetical protein
MEEWMRRFLEQQEQIRRMMEGPLQHFERNRAEIERMSRLLETNLPDSTSQFALLDLKSRLPELGGISALTKEALDTYSLKGSVLEMEKYTSTHREIYDALERAALPYKTVSEQLASISKYYDFTSAALHGLAYDRIGDLIAASEAASSRLALATFSLERRNANLISALGQPEGRLASAPAFATELSAAGLFTHARAVRTITSHDEPDAKAEQESEAAGIEIATAAVAFLEVNLPRLKPEFLMQYHGIKARAVDRGPDWSTQGGASMRKLMKGVLHTAAPNELVAPWAKKHGKAFDKHRRPTRSTKVDWLCEFYPVPEYTATVKMEIMAAVRIIEILDESQHVDDTEEFDKQYEFCMLRVEVAVQHILTIWMARDVMN